MFIDFSMCFYEMSYIFNGCGNNYVKYEGWENHAGKHACMHACMHANTSDEDKGLSLLSGGVMSAYAWMVHNWLVADPLLQVRTCHFRDSAGRLRTGNLFATKGSISNIQAENRWTQVLARFQSIYFPHNNHSKAHMNVGQCPRTQNHKEEMGHMCAHIS